MSRVINRILVSDGSAASLKNALTVGLLLGVALATTAGALVSTIVTNPGTSYTSIPTVTAPSGTADAVLAARMQVQAAAPTAAGSGYAVNDTITMTGGTATVQARYRVNTLKLVTLAVNAAGTGYVVGNTISLSGGSTTSAAVVTVATTKLVSVAVNAGGTGYTATDTVTLAGGTSSTAAVLTVDTVDGGGAILTFTISNPGNYTVNSATFTQASSSGAGTGATFNTGVFGARTVTVTTPGVYANTQATFIQGSTSGSGVGATFNTPLYGVNAISIIEDGRYSVLPSNPVSQGSTSGGGTGFTATVSAWNVDSVVVTGGGTTYANGAALVFAGGGGSSAAGVGTTGGVDEVATFTVETLTELPASYSVFCSLDGPAFWRISEKTATSFRVTLSPETGAALAVANIDILVVG